jgi:2,3-bisphosphoglycerate-dependent phosphoglycerate mutase
MDIDLSEKGRAEAKEAGRLMHNSSFVFDRAYTSVLKRAIRTLWIVLDEMDLMWIPALTCWRLNERFYGDLQGNSKKKMEEKYGKEQVRHWRRGFREHPPPLPDDDERNPLHDLRYKDLETSQIPKTESLEDVKNRLLPFWQGQIASELQQGKNVLVVSHGNTIRSQVMYLEGISDQDIEKVEIPTGVPLVYELDDHLRPKARYYLR